jgi:uncharacterized metal-binding protein YceD (DUF177 family)
MAAGPPDLVDCAQRAADAAVLERVYELADLHRLADVLTDTRGVVHARFAFANNRPGRPGASIEVRAEPRLRCQRCMQGFALTVSGGSQVEFAEDELLLALPIVPACDAPEICGNAPSLRGEPERAGNFEPTRRPFGGLKELLKKT